MLSSFLSVFSFFLPPSLYLSVSLSVVPTVSLLTFLLVLASSLTECIMYEEFSMIDSHRCFSSARLCLQSAPCNGFPHPLMPFPSVLFFILDTPINDSNFRNSFYTIFLASLSPHRSFRHTSARDDYEQECGDSSESYENVSFSKARMRGGDREGIKGGGRPRVHTPDVQRSLQERR